MEKRSDQTVVITRAAQQSDELVEQLRSNGFDSFLFPSLEIQKLKISEAAQSVLVDLMSGRFDWLIFTSVNGVEELKDALDEKGLKSGIPKQTKIAAQGDKTSHKVNELLSRTCDLVPKQFVGEALVQAFSSVNINGKPVLLVGASKSRGVVQQGLKELGAELIELPLYETVCARNNSAKLDKLLQFDFSKLIFTFFSPSAFHFTIELLGNKRDLLKNSRILSIGPVTSKAVVESGFSVYIEASSHSEEGVLQALKSRFT